MHNWKRRLRTRRGIYLISTLLLLTFLVIVGGAVMVSFQQGIASSGNFNNRQMAQQAALAGLQYIQARMETNVTAYSPAGSAGPAVVHTTDSSFQVKEAGYNVCGFITNDNVASSSEGRIYLMFRACFNGQYASSSASPGSWTIASFNGTSYETEVGAMQYISMNNLNRPPSQNSYSYKYDGSTLQTVPGGYADIIVEGMAVSPSGKVLARRVVESMVNIAQIGSISGAASASADMNLTVTATGGKLSVSAADPTANYADDAGLASLNNIYLYGNDAVSGSTMPDYDSPALASLKDSNKKFYYVYNNQSTDFTSSVAQQKVVQPPGLPQSSLAQPTNPTGVTAGTWVIWNGSLYHYPTDYQALDGNGNPIPINSQPWSQSGNSPPKYNGVATDTPGGQPTLDTGGKLVLDSTTNTVTVTQDASVSGSGNTQSFALVVAPSTYTKSDGSTGTITSPQVDSTAAGSAQLVFDPASSTVTPQFRSGGSITVMGNVTGQGSLVSTGRDSSQQTIPGDINVVGKSSIDTRSDSGIALYAAGSLNLLQLSTAQAPSAVPAVNTSLQGVGVTPGSGGNGSSNNQGFTVLANAVDSALAQAFQAVVKKGGINTSYSRSTGTYTYTFSSNSSLAKTLVDTNTGNGDIKVTYNGTTYKGSLTNVLASLIPQKASDLKAKTSSGKTASSAYESVQTLTIGSDQLISGLPSMMSNTSAWNTVNNSFAGVFSYKTTTFSSTTLQNYISYGTATATATPTPTPTPSASPSPTATPSPTPGTVVQGALDQSFSGLVYAGKNVTMKNQLGDIAISGALVAYGADPSASSPGTNGGNININAGNIKIQYDPTLLGPYAQFLGGRVVLKKTCLSVY